MYLIAHYCNHKNIVYNFQILFLSGNVNFTFNMGLVSLNPYIEKNTSHFKVRLLNMIKKKRDALFWF